MAAANPGGPTTGPSYNPTPAPRPVDVNVPSKVRASNPLGPRSYSAPKREATQDMYSVLGRVENSAPHMPGHGQEIFNHPSTNRGATPGALNGQPVRNPGMKPSNPRPVDQGFGPGGTKPTRSVDQGFGPGGGKPSTPGNGIPTTDRLKESYTSVSGIPGSKSLKGSRPAPRNRAGS